MEDSELSRGKNSENSITSNKEDKEDSEGFQSNAKKNKINKGDQVKVIASNYVEYQCPHLLGQIGTVIRTSHAWLRIQFDDGELKSLQNRSIELVERGSNSEGDASEAQTESRENSDNVSGSSKINGISKRKKQRENERRRESGSTSSSSSESAGSKKKRSKTSRPTSRRVRTLNKLKESWLPDHAQFNSETSSSDDSEAEFEPSASEDNMKEVMLFYGDSLTWGMAHNYTGRYEKTWPSLIEKELSEVGFSIAEAGLCSRTTCFDDPNNSDWMPGATPDFFNGLSHFTCEFMNVCPSWLVLLLGTNDLKAAIRSQAKTRTRIDANVLADNCAKIALKARALYNSTPFFDQSKPLKILVVAPAKIKYCDLSIKLGYDDSSLKLSQGLNEAYERMCLEHDFIFVRNDVDPEGSMDGIHFTLKANEEVSNAVLRTVYGIVAPHKLIVKKKVVDNDRDDGFSSDEEDDWFMTCHSRRTAYADDELSSTDSEMSVSGDSITSSFYNPRPRSVRTEISWDSDRDSDEVDMEVSRAAKRKKKKKKKKTPQGPAMFKPGRPSKWEKKFRPVALDLMRDMQAEVEHRLESSEQ